MTLLQQETELLPHDAIVAKETRRFYERFAVEYASSIPHDVTGAMKEWLDVFVAGIERSERVFEIGSGTGRDAAYLESLGYDVQRSEIAEPFLKSFREQGVEALRFDVLTDPFPASQRAVFANSVFCHMTARQLGRALKNVHDALEPGGRLAFNTKADEVRWGATVRNARLPGYRYFSHWPPSLIRSEVENMGFDVLWWSEKPAILRPTPWVNLVVRKRQD